ncbi:MAG TPA: DUF4124 domain-containing protein [Rudaea sp.]|nr:DUF4124 domain-containing protein [Rudaea sp.]
MHGKTIVLLVTAAFGHAVCAGEIYRCTAANGDVMYTNIACPTNSQAQHVASYAPEPVLPSPQVQAEAVQAAAISARLAQQAAADAQTAAYEAAQAAYREQPEAENDGVNYNYADNLLWYPAYPYVGSGFPMHGSGGGHRHHGGGHDGGHGGGHGGGGHGGGRHGAPMQPFQPVSPSSVNLLVRH